MNRKYIDIPTTTPHAARRAGVPAAFLIGAVAGGLTALLLTPQTGAQLRRRFRNGADGFKEGAKGKLASATGVMKGAITETKHAYEEQAEGRRQDRVARRTGA